MSKKIFIHYELERLVKCNKWTRRLKIVWPISINLAWEFFSLGLMIMISCWEICLTFRFHLCVASSGVVLLALFQHCGREKGSWIPTLLMPLSLKPVFFLLVAELVLLLLGFSAQHGNFHAAVGKGSWTPMLPMLSSLKFVFFLLVVGLLLLLLNLATSTLQ